MRSLRWQLVAAGGLLQCLHPTWRLLIGERLHKVFRLVELRLFHLEFAEVKPGYGLRRFALPDRSVLSDVIVLAYACARGGNLHAFGDVERHVISYVLSQAAAAVVGVPVHAGYRKVVAAAFVRNGLLALVVGGNRELLIGRQRFRQYHRKFSVVVLVFLNERQSLPIGSSHASHSQSAEQVEWHHAQTVLSRCKRSFRFASQVGTFFQRGFQLLMFDANGFSKHRLAVLVG